MPNTSERPVDRTTTQHHGSKHLAINDTLRRRLWTLTSLKIARWLRKYKSVGRCQPISKNLIVKTGPSVHLTEAATMLFIAKNTSIPVPHVHCAFVCGNRAYIVMERVEGDAICNVWGDLSDVDRRNIILQLRHMLHELRAIRPPPGTGIQSCVGGSLRDPRMTRSWPRFGPFKTTEDFHLWLRDGLTLDDFPNGLPNREDSQDWEDFKHMVIKQDRPWASPVFTHADLNPSNILVRDGQVVGILDWEISGWYPPYWEYTSACYLPIPAWLKIVDQFLDLYPEELKMETTRQRWWGEV